jgi:hypothetical protein
MPNLADYFSDKQSRIITGLSNIRLEPYRALQLGRRWIYKREDILLIARNQATSQETVMMLPWILIAYPPIECEIHDYLTRTDALRIWAGSHELLYLSSIRRESPTVRYVKFEGITLFNKEDLISESKRLSSKFTKES